MTELMVPHLAVFNNHVNDADRRAREVMRVSFPTYLEKLEQIEDRENGIMAIFNHSPEPATSTYVALVTMFVNEEHYERVSAETPLYEHDCEECVFLGQHEQTGCVYDLYYHGGTHKTVIARYGSDGGEYASGMIFGKQRSVPELTEAYDRAKRMGLDVD